MQHKAFKKYGRKLFAVDIKNVDLIYIPDHRLLEVDQPSSVIEDQVS